MQKRIQWLLAFASTIFLFRAFYYNDPDFLVFEDKNFISIFFHYVIILPILLWIVLVTNKWLYDEWIGRSKIHNIISYETFQKLFTIYHSIIFVIILYSNYIWT